MNFDYEIENEDGEVIATLSVSAIFSPYVPAKTSGDPDDCYPAEGGELEDLYIYEGKRDITKDVDALYGDGTYDAIQSAANDRFDRYDASNDYDDVPDYDDEPTDYWN